MLKGLITRNAHVKYESHASVSKVIVKDKILKMQVKGHGQGHKVIELGAVWKGFISWVCMSNIKSPSLTDIS